ncbi:cation:proton antiporter [Pseudooceanicola sp. CBS1P-1]|uniref:Cyclic nucleotide-binding domain-containing protein n=1 Tax=Pseudooceanicola albus TaxID=2692189 RepID=A0A6L7G673_9RHOB|nr:MULTISPECIES: cation:proton antiporter [Pseudooceanicola]MBT9382984.1 cation:proton antiporter [Pseudooceanicola endophyticus]MXN19172.1 cyclic nucleotide-binding domain-containing protein [Pseudooceanicola albus]
MEIVALTTIVASLFLIVGVCEPLAERLKLPFTVILAVVGMLIGSGAAVFLSVNFANSLNFIAATITDLPIKANAFLYIFLPTLLFQVTLGMDIRRMLDDWVPIILLAVVAVVLSTLAIGFSLYWMGIVSMATGLLVGSVVSTTDPSAVASIFKSLSAPKRLGRIIEGESLLNDAAAIALFGLFITFTMVATPEPTILETLETFPYLVGAGALVGWVMARIGLWIMAQFNRFELAQVSVSVALPYLSYIISEQFLSASGVISVVVCGLALNFTGPGRIDPVRWDKLREVWDLLAHWAGALIFILAAILIPKLMETATWIDLFYVGIVAVAAIAARAVVLFVLLPLLTLTRLSPKVETPYKIAILWGGLRGAVTLALALAVTENPLILDETKHAVGILATGFTLFTLIVQGISLRAVIGRLKLDRLSPIDVALSKQVVAVALQSVRERVARAAEHLDLTKEIVRAEAKDFAERLDAAVDQAESEEGILDRDRITLGLIALAGHELDLVDRGYEGGLMSAKVYEQVRALSERVLEGARSSGRTGYRAAYREALGFDSRFRMAVFLDNRTRISRPLAVLTADRFEFLLAQRLVLKGLHDFIDTRIRRIHRRRVAELLHELVERRIEAVEQAQEALKLQYPGYAEELERKFIRRTGLRLERQELDDLMEEGLIGPELHLTLIQKLDAKANRERARPKLDLAVRKVDLAQQIPLFAEFDKATLKQLSKTMVTRFASPGEILRRRSDMPRSVFFIASGAVEIRGPKQTNRLGRGDMFGSISLLTGERYRGDVQAIAPTTLLVLDEARFRKMLTTRKGIRKAILRMAEDRDMSDTAREKLRIMLGNEEEPSEDKAAAKAAKPAAETPPPVPEKAAE